MLCQPESGLAHFRKSGFSGEVLITPPPKFATTAFTPALVSFWRISDWTDGGELQN
jgi:hypothetical protein